MHYHSRDTSIVGTGIPFAEGFAVVIQARPTGFVAHPARYHIRDPTCQLMPCHCPDVASEPARSAVMLSCHRRAQDTLAALLASTP